MTIKSKTAAGLAAILIAGSGLRCAPVNDMVEEQLPTFLQSQGYKDRNTGPWAGTAVANRIVNPDGSIVFILDAKRIGKSIDINYADRFLDTTRYNKKWVRNGKFGFIVTYTLKE